MTFHLRPGELCRHSRSRHNGKASRAVPGTAPTESVEYCWGSQSSQNTNTYECADRWKANFAIRQNGLSDRLVVYKASSTGWRRTRQAERTRPHRNPLLLEKQHRGESCVLSGSVMFIAIISKLHHKHAQAYMLSQIAITAISLRCLSIRLLLCERLQWRPPSQYPRPHKFLANVAPVGSGS